MTPDELIAEIEASIADMEGSIARYRSENPDPEDPITRVYAGGDLQTALDGGGIVQIMDAGATFERSRFVISKSDTELRGNSATLRSSSGPALWVPPGVRNVQVRDIQGATSTYQTVFQLGDNDRTTQGTLDRVPRNIVMERCRVPTHRQKRGFEVNAAEVKLLNCSAVDVYNTIIVDSQALSIMNSPGPVYVEGGEWSAASECVMVGGDSMKLPAGTNPTGLTFKNMHIFKPVSWRTDGLRRGVKNLLELKSGTNVLIENSLLENTWTDAQVSCGIVITPRNGLNISNVLVNRCTVRNVGMGMNIMSVNSSEPRNDTATDLVRVLDSTFIVDHRVWGASGFFAQILNTNGYGPVGKFEVENCYVSASAGYYVMMSLQPSYVTDNTVDPPVKTPKPTELIRLANSRLMVPYYNTTADWFHTGSAPEADAVKKIEITGNTIGAGNTVMKTRYPTNTFITDAEFKLLPQAPPSV